MMSMIKWQPKASLLSQLHHDLFDVLDKQPSAEGYGNLGQWMPHVDVEETDKNFNVSVEVPGVSPKSINIQMDGNKLVVSGEKNHEYENNEKGVYRMERSYGSFYREFTLPKSVDGDNIQARSQHGVLFIEIPKSLPAQSRQIPIEEV